MLASIPTADIHASFDYDFPVYITPAPMDAAAAAPVANYRARTNYRTLSPSAAAAAAQKGRARGPSFASTASSSSGAYYPSATASSSRRPSAGAASRLAPSWERGYAAYEDEDEFSVDSGDEFDDTDAFAYSYQYDQPPSAYVTSRGTSLASRQLQKQQKLQQRRPHSRSQSPFADADPLAPISHSSSYYADSPRSLALSLPPLSVSYEEESPLRSAVLSEEYQAELRRERERELEQEREKEKAASFEGYRKLTLGLGMRRKKYAGWDLDAETDAEKEAERRRGTGYALEEHATYQYDPDVAVDTNEEDDENDHLHDDMTPDYTPSCTQIVHRRWQALSLSWRTSVFRAKRRLRRRVGL